MGPYAIPLAALIVSVATLVGSWVSMKRYAPYDHLRSLEARVVEAERRLLECEAAKASFMRDNVALLGRIGRLEADLDAPTRRHK